MTALQPELCVLILTLVRGASAVDDSERTSDMDTRATIANAFLAFPTQKKARFGTVTWMSLKLLPIWDSQALVSCAFPLVPLLIIELTSRSFQS